MATHDSMRDVVAGYESGPSASAPQSAAKKKASKKKAGKKKAASKRKYSRKASKKVGTAVSKLKKGTLKSGRSGQKVKSRKQAIAIGLSEARKGGAKVPPAPKRKRKSA